MSRTEAGKSGRMAGQLPAIRFVRRSRGGARFVAARFAVVLTDGGQNRRSGSLSPAEGLCQRGAVAAIEVNVVARCIGDVQAGRVALTLT